MIHTQRPYIRPLLFFLFIFSATCVELKCNIVQNIHPQFAGVGIFAGKDYSDREVIERNLALLHPQHLTINILAKYVFEHFEGGHSAVILGNAMVIARIMIVYAIFIQVYILNFIYDNY